MGKKPYWKELEESGIGYDFYDSDQLVVRKYDNGENYVKIIHRPRKNGKKVVKVFYNSNDKPSENLKEMQGEVQTRKQEIRKLEKELASLEDGVKLYKKLEGLL